MSECCYCTDPKGDILCEKCADEIYDLEEPGDEESWRFSVTVLALALAGALAFGFAWGYAVALVG
jgi:hypothetical protein